MDFLLMGGLISAVIWLAVGLVGLMIVVAPLFIWLNLRDLNRTMDDLLRVEQEQARLLVRMVGEPERRPVRQEPEVQREEVHERALAVGRADLARI